MPNKLLCRFAECGKGNATVDVAMNAESEWEVAARQKLPTNFLSLGNTVAYL